VTALQNGPHHPTRRSAFVLAWLVHAYTASGAVLGFLALRMAFVQDFRSAFIFLAIALIIDSSDGALARTFHVKKVLPWVDGAMLDNLIDYMNFVIVPVGIMVQPGILPQEWSWLPLSVLVASAYGFSRTDAKGVVEHYFLGFPSYWNVMAFYFVALRTPPTLNLALLVVAVVMVFVPMRWIYPSRSEVFRGSMVTLGIVWGLMTTWMLWRLPEASPWIGTLSLFYPAYYTAASVVYHFRY